MKASKFLVTFAAMGLALLWVTAARADVIPITTFQISPPLGSMSSEADYIEDLEGLTFDLTGLFKLDDGGDTDGELDGSQFVINAVGGVTATVSWDLTSTGYFLDYILIKDGKETINNVEMHLYSLYGVTPDQRISSDGDQIINFFITPDDYPDGYYAKAISHISFYGTVVPEPTTLLLLGTGLLAVGFAYRKRMKL